MKIKNPEEKAWPAAPQCVWLKKELLVNTFLQMMIQRLKAPSLYWASKSEINQITMLNVHQKL
jgi:hypothetical protein